MNSITYYPSKDELLFKRHPVKGKPNLRKGRFSFWWDSEGGIQAVDIRGFTEEQRELARARNVVRLKGLWKGLTFTEEDIREARRELLRKLEEKW